MLAVPPELYVCPIVDGPTLTVNSLLEFTEETSKVYPLVPSGNIVVVTPACSDEQVNSRFANETLIPTSKL